jgi:hypothetical protein
MTKADLLFQFEIVALDPAALLGQIDNGLERNIGGRCEQPIVVVFGIAVQPRDHQPFLRRRLAALGIAMGRTKRRRAMREARGALLPARNSIRCQASAAGPSTDAKVRRVGSETSRYSRPLVKTHYTPP